MAQAVG